MSLARAAYRMLAAIRAPGIARGLRPGAPVFCFHNVVPTKQAGAGDAALHMALPEFRRICDWIRLTYEVAPLGEITERARAGKGIQGLAAITFDDAYRGVYDTALPLLSAAGIPSTVFVVSGFPANPAFTWWDVLGSQGLLTNEVRERALSVHRGLAEEIVAPLSVQPGRELPASLLPATWREIGKELTTGVTLGSHTVRHANLVALTERELREELRHSRHQILERTGQEPHAVSYPYGLWNLRVSRAAAAAGYRAGFTLGDRPVRRGDEAMSMPRINIPAGIPLEALDCWAAGLGLHRYLRAGR